MRNLDEPSPIDNNDHDAPMTLYGIHPYALIGAITVGCIAFGIVFYVTKEQPAQPQAFAQELPAAPAPEPVKQEAVPPKDEPKAKAPPAPKVEPKKTTPVIFCEVVAAEPTDHDPKDILKDRHHFRTVALNYDGSRLLTTSDTKIIRWDTTTGKVVQSFDRGDQWKETLFAAPDSRTVVQMHHASKTITVFNAETRAVIGRYTVAGDLRHYASGHLPAFSPDGEEMTLLEEVRVDIGNTIFAIHTINLRTVEGKAFAKGFTLDGKPFKRRPLYLYPIPGQRELLCIVQYIGSSMDDRNNAYAVNIDTGAVRQLPWLANASLWAKYPGHHITPLGDGSQIIFKSEEHGPAIATWPKGDIYPLPSVGGYRWTPDRIWMPDGYRMLRVNAWDGKYVKLGYGNVPGYQIDYLELVDLSRAKVVSSFSHKELLASNEEYLLKSLAVSGDGKTIALMGKTRVGMVHFDRLYKAAPLAPAKQARGYLK